MCTPILRICMQRSEIMLELYAPAAKRSSSTESAFCQSSRLGSQFWHSALWSNVDQDLVKFLELNPLVYLSSTHSLKQRIVFA